MLTPALQSFADHAAARPGPVLVIGGPTATGKSGLALDLAQRYGGVIINADSMQIYRDLRVLTARPGPQALAAAPHRLYGTLPASDACSAARWRTLALAEIAACHHEGALPIVVGGTGLYLRALMLGLSNLPDIPADIRAAARERLAQIGPAALHAELAGQDPVSAARLNPADRQRIVRAWEVLEATGRPLSSWQMADQGQPPPGLSFTTIIFAPPRAGLYASCDGRFAAMIAAGGLDEARTVETLALDPTMPALKALGLPELRRHLAGDLSLDDAIAIAQQSTRRYAKRQGTWFRHQLIGHAEPQIIIDYLWPPETQPGPPRASM